jgi:hypothetical protein
LMYETKDVADGQQENYKEKITAKKRSRPRKDHGPLLNDDN